MSWLWLLLIVYGVGMFFLSPRTVDTRGFYWGHDRNGREAGVWLLSASVLITWVFAKSVTNAANLGAAFGLVGGVAYAAYYLSIPVAGVVIAAIRHRHRVKSLAEYVVATYGRTAALAFLLVVWIRLFNEVWSNTAVVGAYFGEKGSLAYYAAALGFTAFTLLYTLKGGMRSSLVTDAIQLGLAAFFLFLALGQVLPAVGARPILTAGEWTFRGGVDLLLVAMIQCLSYPFHDPVLTDRGFLTERRAMRRAFLWAGLGGFVFILLSSWIGIYAYLNRIPFTDDSPRAVAQSLGLAALLVMNVVMLSSAGSTLDSTLTAFSKAAGIDVAALAPRLLPCTDAARVRLGRIVMTAMALLGNLPLFADASILKATTVSGTMVMGLAPIFLFHTMKGVPPISFHLAFWPGIALGVWYAFWPVPVFLAIGSGKYAGLLGINVYGVLLCAALYVLPVAVRGLAPRPVKVSPALE